MMQGKKYGAILADPPWLFRNWSAKGEGRNPLQQYGVERVADLAKLPIRDCAASDCALFMWIMDAMLLDALELIDAWGFQYRTVAFIWAKSAQAHLWDFPMGMGYWTRKQGELCLLATRGKPPRLSKGVRQLILDPRREHSRKPDETYDRIQQLVAGPYLELFARQRWPGWDAWGNEVDKFKAAPIAAGATG